MKDKKNFRKGMAAALMAAVLVSSINPIPVLAAGKTFSATVMSPKKNAKVSGNKITIHTKSAIQLKVKFAGKNITEKATYKVSSPKVVDVDAGKLTVKKNGKATLTVKYKGNTKKFTVSIASKHFYYPHYKTTIAKKTLIRCSCGKGTPYEKKKCQKCQANNPYMAQKKLCICKALKHDAEHTRKGEPMGYWEEHKGDKITHKDYYVCDCGAKTKTKPMFQ